MKFDVIVCGSGIAGIYCALNIDPKYKVAIVSNDELNSCNTYLAQGGITTVRGKEDKPFFIKDTLFAGGNENDLETLNIVADEAEENVKQLIDWGTPFNKDEEGNLLYTKEAAHSKRRILHVNDQTGKYIFLTLAKELEKRKNITPFSHVEIVDLVRKTCADERICGIVGEKKDKTPIVIEGERIVLATGGIGGLFKNSTNKRNLRGVGIALVKRHGGELKKLDYIQFHPTAFYDKNSERRFLISESLRGEGAYLRNSKRERFVDELLPRDVVSRSIELEKKKNNDQFVYLDATHLDPEFLKVRFHGIYEKLKEKGYDLGKDLIPVTTSQHYFMGGVAVDMDGKTSLGNVFACGEVAWTGLHGKNRLASNSLLEGLVFGKRVAEKITKELDGKDPTKVCMCQTGIPSTSDIEKMKEENKKIVVEEILKVRGDLKDELFIGR